MALLTSNISMAQNDMTAPVANDSATVADTVVTKKPLFSRAVKGVLKFFSPDVDTTYIEPQKYNFAAMAQATLCYDHYTLRSGTDYDISFSPSERISVGPYFGWRWLFLGYTFDINIADVINGNTDINFNIYTAAVGINLLYRKLNNYRLGHVSICGTDYTDFTHKEAFPGLNVSVKGLNLYYVLNSKQYSHQAAYNQTNRQIRNAGSLIVGTGYDHHSISSNWQDLLSVLPQKASYQLFNDDIKLFDQADYKTISLSVGYGYNWVFAKNWLAGAQLIGSASYIWSDTERSEVDEKFVDVIKNFNFNNFTGDLGLRLGIVWNNAVWYAGGSALFNSYNYHNNGIFANNTFGTMNVYVGYNFGKRNRK